MVGSHTEKLLASCNADSDSDGGRQRSKDGYLGDLSGSSPTRRSRAVTGKVGARFAIILSTAVDKYVDKCLVVNGLSLDPEFARTREMRR